MRPLLLALALALTAEALAAWRLDRRLNGVPRRRGATLARRLVRLGLGLAALVPALRRLPGPSGAQLLLRRAGSPQGIAAEELGALRGGAIAAALCPALLTVVSGGPARLLAPALVVGAAAYPELWLRSLATRRAEAIERQAPLALELLAATVAAGIGLDTALAEAARAVAEPLRGELELVGRNLALGRRRAEELRDLAARSSSPTLHGLAVALRTSEELGVPLADGLRRQAARARLERAQRAQERSATAAPRILLVVVLVLVPAALLPLVTAVALTLAGSLRGGGLLG